MQIVERSIAAKAVTFVATKVTKKAVSREASLRTGLCPAKRTEPGLQLFCATSFALSIASAKTCYAPHPHRPPLFCPFSPEAYLLTGKRKSDIKLFLIFSKSSPWLFLLPVHPLAYLNNEPAASVCLRFLPHDTRRLRL